MTPRLPNASVGKEYHQSLHDLLAPEGGQIEDLHVLLPEGSGLDYDAGSGSLRGTPLVAGELEVEVTLVSKVRQTIALTVNPDPSSLWKDLPSDPDGKFAKPDSTTDYQETPDLHVISASLRGRSHAHEGKYRDDDFQVRHLEESGWHLFAAADGAGSAEFSRRGSQVACQAALDELARNLARADPLDALLDVEDDISEDAIRRQLWHILVVAAFEAHKAVSKEAEVHGEDLKKFSTTLLLVIAKRIRGQWFFGGFNVGDGGAAALADDFTLLPLSKPDGGEFSGQTLFVTHSRVFEDSTSLMQRICTGFLPSLSYLALMTDGVTDPLFPSDSALADADCWKKLFAEFDEPARLASPGPETPRRVLEWLGFPSPGNHDDRTLIVAIPRRANEGEPSAAEPATGASQEPGETPECGGQETFTTPS